MRLILLSVLAVACTEPQPPPMSEKSAMESLRAPRTAGIDQISGTVAKREGGALLLNSGGSTPIALQFDDSTRVTIDGYPGKGSDIKEGDLVRAAYRYDRSGEPLALRVVANTHPPHAGPLMEEPPASGEFPQKK